MDVNRSRRVDHVRWSVAVEISLFHAAVFERDCSPGHELCQSKHYSRLKLTFDGERVHRYPRIHCNGRAVYLGAPALDGDVHCTCDTGSERLVACNAQGMPLR